MTSLTPAVGGMTASSLVALLVAAASQRSASAARRQALAAQQLAVGGQEACETPVVVEKQLAAMVAAAPGSMPPGLVEAVVAPRAERSRADELIRALVVPWLGGSSGSPALRLWRASGRTGSTEPREGGTAGGRRR
jgi:hypothetical protein